MKLSVGDKVKIISRAEFNKRKNGRVYAFEKGCMFIMNEEMASFCGKQAKVIEVINSHFKLDIDNGRRNWCEWMVKLKTK